MTKILFVDLDGTLVGRDGVAERVWPALAALRAAGWRIAVCTGRPGRGIALDIARRLDPEGLHVFESGAVVMRGSGEVVMRHAIADSVVVQMAALGVEHGLTLEAYSADGRYLAREHDDYIAGHEALLGFAADLVRWPPVASAIGVDVAPIVRLQWVVSHDRWAWLSGLGADVFAGLSVHEGHSPKMPGVSFVSMVAPGISKATGVGFVLHALGVAPADAAMAGDNLNDVPAFAVVGQVFVPADGVAAALALAHHVVPSADEGGVAEVAAILLRG